MKFSVIIIAHKRTEFLNYAIESITMQNGAYPLEVIIVRNSNIDLGVVSENNHNIKIIDLVSIRETLAGKLIEGIKLSHGEYLMFLEDDDLFQPNKILQIERILLYHPFLDYIHNSQYFFNVNGEMRDYYSQIKKDLVLPGSNKQAKMPILKNLGFNLSSVTVSKKFSLVIAREIPPNLNFSVDLFIFLLAFSIPDVNLLFTRDKLTKFRIHESSHITTVNFRNFVNAEAKISLNYFDELGIIRKRFEGFSEISNLIDDLRNYWEVLELIFGNKNIESGKKISMLILYTRNFYANKTKFITFILYLSFLVCQPLSSYLFYAYRILRTSF